MEEHREEALKRIAAVKADGGRILDLSSLNLEQLPIEIKSLTQLRRLDCSENRLTSLTGIESLTQLISLSCNQNKLVSLAGIERLAQLQELYCFSNQLTSLIEIKDLTQLIDLFCQCNQLTSLAGIESLTNIERLNCGANNLISIDEVAPLTKLWDLNCLENPIRHIPNVLLNDLLGLKNYWDELKEGVLDNNRVKLLLVGNGRVGKTTLAKALQTRQPVTESFESTVGILIDNLTYPNKAGGPDWILRVWDFGGQELYHATHRLFLCNEGIYLVVWAESTDEADSEIQYDLRYYLDMILISAPSSDIIVVKNQIDRANKTGQNHLTLTESQYRNLPHCLISAKHHLHVEKLELEIQCVLDKIAYRKIQIPKSWGKVRAELELLNSPSISYAQFEALCEQKLVKHPLTLIQYLHTNGDCYFLGMQFGQTIFLDQNWLLNAVYCFFKTGNRLSPRTSIERDHGTMTGAAAVEYLNYGTQPPRYSVKETATFLNYMTQSSLAFKLTDNPQFVKCTFVLPSLLPSECPIAGEPKHGSYLTYQLQYPWLHSLVIDRLIIKLHHFSNQSNWWRNGIRIVVRQNGNDQVCTLVSDTRLSTITLYFYDDNPKNLLLQIVQLIERCGIAKPTGEKFKFGSDNWVDKNTVIQLHGLSDLVKDQNGEKVDGMLYYQLLGLKLERELQQIETLSSYEVSSRLNVSFAMNPIQYLSGDSLKPTNADNPISPVEKNAYSAKVDAIRHVTAFLYYAGIAKQTGKISAKMPLAKKDGVGVQQAPDIKTLNKLWKDGDANIQWDEYAKYLLGSFEVIKQCATLSSSNNEYSPLVKAAHAIKNNTKECYLLCLRLNPTGNKVLTPLSHDFKYIIDAINHSVP